MAGKVFINYRRSDDPGFTQALCMRLAEEFPAADLFIDNPLSAVPLESSEDLGHARSGLG
jgi:hypothetical protein